MNLNEANEKPRTEKQPNRVLPDYEDNLCMDVSYYELLNEELVQCTDEGLDLGLYAPVFTAAARLPRGEVKKKIADALFEVVSNAKIREGYPYEEPSDYSEIMQLCKGEFRGGDIPDAEEMERKVYGAWLGRICGCMLGKTIEGIHTDELIPLLQETGNYPLRRYIRRADMSEEIYAKYKYALKSRIYIDEVDGMPADDDTNYVVMAQHLIEHFGREFTPSDVAREWLDLQPKSAYWTAEQVAYCNFIKGFVPPQSAFYQNPFREWIGAQIRGDYFGYINPGNPRGAAEMAFRDACISHVKNGIYGEMFAAAMIACAVTEQDIEKIIEGGLTQVPATSRLYEHVMRVLNDYRKGVSCKKVFAAIHKEFDEYTSHGLVHTISNAMIVTAALLYGKGDFGKSICLAVETGFDTDCNGATVGSILGMRNGHDKIGAEWKQPIGDKLYTEIKNFPCVSIHECVKKTMEHIAGCPMPIND